MTDPNVREIHDLQPVAGVAPVSVMEAMVAAEVDKQIATAKRYPRSVQAFMRTVNDLVTMNEGIAEGCIYALPRDGKNIEGPSARFAEIVASSWGNCRASAQVISEDEEFVTAQGIFHDLERNVAIAFQVRRRITNKRGERFSSDMIAVTGNAAGSIALRNAILKGIPKVFWEPGYEAARKTIVGETKTLANKRASALALMQKFGATPEQVFEKLGIKGADEIMEDQLITLRGYASSLKDGEVSFESIFGVPPKTEKPKTGGEPQVTTAPKAEPAAPAAEAPAAAAAGGGNDGGTPTVTLAGLEDELANAKTADKVNELIDLSRGLTDGKDRTAFKKAAAKRIAALTGSGGSIE